MELFGVCNIKYYIPTMTQLYLNPVTFAWPYYLESHMSAEKSKVRRSYDTLSHAASLLEGKVTEYALADSVTNLKRAVNIRLKLIDELHRYSGMKSPRKMGALEKLEYMGLIRPFLIRQLFELRNDIEHNDAMPPSLGRAKELVDIVWYFLRSTDSVVSFHSGTLLFEHPDNSDDLPGLWLNVEPLSIESHEAKVSGWLCPPFLTFDEGLPIAVEEIRSPPAGAEETGFSYFEDHSKRPPDHRYINGSIMRKDEPLVEVWKCIFDLT